MCVESSVTIRPSTVCAASGRGDWGLKWACDKAEGTRINLFPLRFRQINHLLNAWTSKSRYTTTGGRELISAILFCRIHLSSIATESERKQNQFSLRSGAKNHYVQLALQDSRYNSAGDWVPAIAITQTQDSRSTLSFLSMATEGRLLVQHQGISWKNSRHLTSFRKVKYTMHFCAMHSTKILPCFRLDVTTQMKASINSTFLCVCLLYPTRWLQRLNV